jgi:hypothetical protein
MTILDSKPPLQCQRARLNKGYCLNNAPTAKSKILVVEVVVLNFLATVSSAMSPKIRPISESTMTSRWNPSTDSNPRSYLLEVPQITSKLAPQTL